MKHRIFSLSIINLILGLFGLIFAGCTEAPTVKNGLVTPSITITTEPVTPTQMPSQIPNSSTPTPNHTSTLSTYTQTPPALSPTSKPTSTETAIPIPTAPGSEITEQALWLFETNNGCQLPCWWGIILGQTSWVVAREFLTVFDQNIYETSTTTGRIYYGILIPVPTEAFIINRIEVGFLVRDGAIEEISFPLPLIETFSSEHFTQYTLPRILTTYGPPSEVWLSTYSDSFEEGDLPFIISLIYFDQGILASYATNGEKQGDLIQGCFSSIPATRFYLWLPSLYSTFEQATSGKSVFNRDYLVLEESTGIDVLTFYETFKNPDNTVCLETPANLWKP